jgi:hypothetical protein
VRSELCRYAEAYRREEGMKEGEGGEVNAVLGVLGDLLYVRISVLSSYIPRIFHGFYIANVQFTGVSLM